MNRLPRILAAVLVSSGALVDTSAIAQSASASLRGIDEALRRPNSFLIRGATIFDGERIIDRGSVLVRGGWIERLCAADDDAACVDPTVTVIDANGKFLMPAMIDAEGHFNRPVDALDQLLVRDAAVCGEGTDKGQTLRASTAEVMSAFVTKGLLTEVDTHGLRIGSGWNPHAAGGRYPLAPSANYEKHLRFGVATVLDMSAYPWPANYVRRSRDRWRAPRGVEDADLQREFLVYADLFTAGMWAAPPMLHFGYYGVDPVYNVQPEGPWKSSDVRAWVRRRVAEGSDHVKVFYDHWRGRDVPKISPATLKALVQAAHEQKLRVFVHNHSEEASEALMDAGADVNIHLPGGSGFGGPPISDEFVARFARLIHAIVPTLTPFVSGCRNPFSPSNRLTHALSQHAPGMSFMTAAVETADVLPYINAFDEARLAACEGLDDFERNFRNLAALFDAGVTLMVGADAGDFSPQVEGLSVHYEAWVMSEALKRYSKTVTGRAANLAVLKAATSNAARVYGLHRENGNRPTADPRGFVKPGYRADLLLLHASPMDDMLNTLKIDRVFKAGYDANRQMVRPECASGDCESRRVLREIEERSCR